MAAATFSALGSMVCSSTELRGMAGRFSAPITVTGASRSSKQVCCMRDATDCAKVLLTGYSVITRQRLFLFTEAKISSVSSGISVRKSIISTWPGKFLAAFFAQ